MRAATQIYYATFDSVFFKLTPSIRRRVELEIGKIGSHLDSFPHRRLKGSNRFRARVGDYRVIYTLDSSQNVIHLLAIGHRREIYRRI